MEPPPAEQAMLDRILQLLLQRSESYETGVQTSVCFRTNTGWLNGLTKTDFVRKGQEPPATIKHEYRNVVIIRRLLAHTQLAILLNQLSAENKLELGDSLGSVPLQARLSIGGKSRWSHSEWSPWPADVFTFEPPSGQSWPPDEPLIAVDEPYYLNPA